MGDGADDARNRDGGDFDGDPEDIYFAHRDRPVTFSHARRAPVQEPPFNAGKVTALRETAKAVLCDRGNGRPAEWCPKTQIAATSQVKKSGDVGDLIVTAWIAREKGWSR